MGILSINVNTTGLIGSNIEPRRVTMVTTDSLATVTTAGYINNFVQSNFTILPTDILDVKYSYNQQTGANEFAILEPVFSGVGDSQIITLTTWVNPGNAGIALPVTINHLAIFDSTAGEITQAASDVTSLSSGPVTIQSGSLTLSSGSVVAKGSVVANSPTASKGSLKLTPVDNTANYDLTISNQVQAQSSTLSIPDPGAATGAFLIRGSSTFTSGHILQADSIQGRMVDSGFGLIVGRTGNIGAGGAGPITVAVAGLNDTSNVQVSMYSSSNPVSIIAVQATVNSFAITFSADPGASCIVQYIAETP